MPIGLAVETTQPVELSEIRITLVLRTSEEILDALPDFSPSLGPSVRQDESLLIVGSAVVYLLSGKGRNASRLRTRFPPR